MSVRRDDVRAASERVGVRRVPQYPALLGAERNDVVTDGLLIALAVPGADTDSCVLDELHALQRCDEEPTREVGCGVDGRSVLTVAAEDRDLIREDVVAEIAPEHEAGLAL